MASPQVDMWSKSGVASWSSKLQPLVALSTTEAEHISAVEAGKEILWMHQFMGGLAMMSLVLYCYAIAVNKNPRASQQDEASLTLSILVEVFKMDGLITPTFVTTQEMAADIFTKALDWLRCRSVQKCLVCSARSLEPLPIHGGVLFSGICVCTLPQVKFPH
jgi:hypothetical protein